MFKNCGMITEPIQSRGLRSLTMGIFAFLGESPAYQSNQLLQTTEHVHVLLYVGTNVGHSVFFSQYQLILFLPKKK